METSRTRKVFGCVVVGVLLGASLGRGLAEVPPAGIGKLYYYRAARLKTAEHVVQYVILGIVAGGAAGFLVDLLLGDRIARMVGNAHWYEKCFLLAALLIVVLILFCTGTIMLPWYI